MSQTPVPITGGTGTSSIAAELVNGTSWQQVEIYGQGGASVLSINPDGSFKASIIGTPTVIFTGSPSISGAVTIVGNSIPNGSVSGTVGASIIGTVPVTFSNASISGTVGASIVGQLPAGNAVIGSVVALQGTNPWIITGSVQASVTPAANQSVSGTVGASIIGLTPVTFSGSPSISGAVTIVGATIPPGSVSGSVGIVGTPSISGTVNIAGNPSISGQVGASVIGTVPVTQSGPWTTSVVGTVSVIGTVSVVGTVTNQLAPTASLVSGVTSVITGTASVLVLATPAGGQRNYITNLTVTNGSATGTFVNFLDGPTVIFSGYAAASGGGFVGTFPAPLRQGTTSNLGVQSSVQASIIANASGYTAV